MIASVEGNDPAASTGATACNAFIPGIVGGTVATVDASTVSLASAITSGTTNPYGVAVITSSSAASLAAIEIWITESGTNTVTVFNASTGAVTNTIVVGIYPHGITITPVGKGATAGGTTAYVAGTGPDTGPGGSQIVSVIDVGTYAVTANVTVAEAPRILALSPDASLVAVTCADGLYVITTADNSVYRAEAELQQSERCDLLA